MNIHLFPEDGITDANFYCLQEGYLENAIKDNKILINFLSCYFFEKGNMSSKIIESELIDFSVIHESESNNQSNKRHSIDIDDDEIADNTLHVTKKAQNDNELDSENSNQNISSNKQRILSNLNSLIFNYFCIMLNNKISK